VKQQDVKADPEAVEQAKQTWHGFTAFSKWSIIAVVAILILMAIFLL